MINDLTPEEQEELKDVGIDPNEIQELGPAQSVYNRLTANISVHHEQSGEDPKSFLASFSAFLASDEECYSRRRKATEEWQQVDTGWLEGQVGYLLIQNLEGVGQRQRNPVKEEQQATAMKKLRLRYMGELLPAPIGPSQFFFSPIESTADLKIGAPHCAPVSYRITVYPS